MVNSIFEVAKDAFDCCPVRQFRSMHNWQTLLTENEMSSLVRDKYWRLPTIFLKRVGLSKESELNLERCVEADMG